MNNSQEQLETVTKFDARDFKSKEQSYRDLFKRTLEVAEEVQKSNPQPMYPQMNWINADDDIYR